MDYPSKLAGGEYTTEVNLPPDGVPLFLWEITTAHEDYGDFTTVGYTYDQGFSAEVARRYNMHAGLVHALLAAQEAILGAQDNCGVLDDDDADMVMSIIGFHLGLEGNQ